mgnify:CR=1 FL=1
MTEERNLLLFYHRNPEQTVFDIAVAQQGMENVESQMMNPLKDLTFGGYLFGNNLEFTDTTDSIYAGTDYRAWNFHSSKASRKEQFCIVLHTDQTETVDQWEQGLKTTLQRIAPQGKISSKIVSQDKKQTRAWWNSFWQRSFIEAIGEAENKDGNDVEGITRNYTLFRYMLGCNAYGSVPTKFNGGLFTFDPCHIDDKQNKRQAALRRWRRQMTKLAAGVTALMCLLTLWPVQAQAAELPIQSRAALLMEKTTGQVLYARNEHEQLEPASVTKIMTLLLTMEAIDSGTIGYDDVVTVSAYAAGMGGSQVYLAEGEQITVEELLKAVCVASGNDAAAALAEKVAGVSDRFVEKMNQRAAELGMNDTHFANCTGLTAEGHVTSAYDIAVMSRELILKHPDIRRFTTIWMDTIRGGAFQLANTNKLIRFYDGATGLKTGYTASAGYCISATAERDGMELIAVVMKGPDRDTRNNDAKALLNYGFSSYALVTAAPEQPLLCNPTGNPGMATGGSGDVLAGIIGSLAAQGLTPVEAAACGVWLHGAAGDAAAARLSQHSMLPSDLVEELGGLFLKFEK